MARQSEQLEREAEEARAELTYSLDELRQRLTPGKIVNEVVDYARDTPAADFARNVARDVRAYPLPLVLIFAGIAWAVVASALAQRRTAMRATPPVPTTDVEACPAEPVPGAVQPEWEVAPLSEAID